MVPSHQSFKGLLCHFLAFKSLINRSTQRFMTSCEVCLKIKTSWNCDHKFVLTHEVRFSFFTFIFYSFKKCYALIGFTWVIRTPSVITAPV